MARPVGNSQAKKTQDGTHWAVKRQVFHSLNVSRYTNSTTQKNFRPEVPCQLTQCFIEDKSNEKIENNLDWGC